MRFIRMFLLAAVAASLAGCAFDEATFNKVRPLVRKRPDIQAKYMADCTYRVKYESGEMKRYVAGFMHTSVDGLPEKVCGRLLRGYLNGRMRYQDIDLLRRGQKFTPNLVAILRAG